METWLEVLQVILANRSTSFMKISIVFYCISLHRCTSFKVALSVTTSVTFRPRSTSVAGTVSNAEGLACCCSSANDEDGYRVGAGQGFKITAVAVGHLGR